MKKLKLRFKKALFAFFKEEILESVGHIPTASPTVNISHLNFIEIKSKIILDDRNQMFEPSNIVYERALEKCRKEIFEEAMKFVVVDEDTVINPIYYPHRAISVSLLVSKKNG